MRKSVHSAAQRQLQTLLRDHREKRGLTQTEVARRLRKPQSFVAKYEAGERRLDVVEFLKVAQAIEADPIRLVRALMRVSS
jgi:transcriptional regulator with XRE-family HTH domain